MTDKETLYLYRLKQAQETLDDARNMIDGSFSTRSIVNRAYYSAFYATLALFLKQGLEIKTSKHSGIISLFDKELVHAGKIGPENSKILHKLFEARQESDYKELVLFSKEETSLLVEEAGKFLGAIKKL